MGFLDRFVAYAADFEKTYQDDDWSRLEPYFTEDATYRIENVPFAAEMKGRDAVLEGIRKSISGFDRKTRRELEVVGAPEVEGNRVSVAFRVTYTIEGAPPVTIAGRETAELADDGRIRSLLDVYDEGIEEAVLAWQGEHGAGLDPSYV